MTAVFAMLPVFATLACQQNGPPTQSPSDHATASYVPVDRALYDTVVALDRTFFAAFNGCDLETQATMLADDLEFFHDSGGYTNSKTESMEAVRTNICGKVTRSLVEGSIEVYPIPDYGAVQMGTHTFFNKREPDAPQSPGKFVHIWRNDDGVWQITKVISLH